MFKSRQREPGVRDVEWLVFYEFPLFVFYAPLIAIGGALAAANWFAPEAVSERVMALVWAAALVFTLLAVGLDFSRHASALLFLSLFSLVLAGLWAGLQFNVPIFSSLLHAVGLMDLRISAQAVLLISGALAAIYVGMLINVWMNHRWIAAGEAVILRRPFRDQIILPLTAVRPPQKNIDDFFEYLFLGAGTIVLYDPEGRERRISRVLFVDRKARRLGEYVQSVEVEQDRPRISA